jgi:hypothetical protein
MGSSLFRADLLTVPMNQILKRDRNTGLESPVNPQAGKPALRRRFMGSPDLQNWMHIGTMNQAMGAPGTAPASWHTFAPNEPCLEAGAPVHGGSISPKSGPFQETIVSFLDDAC